VADGTFQRLLPGVAFTRTSDVRWSARFKKSEMPAAEVLARIVGAAKVADIALPEPSIELVIRRIYEKAGGKRGAPKGLLPASTTDAKAAKAAGRP
jgi:hypothetical protein